MDSVKYRHTIQCYGTQHVHNSSSAFITLEARKTLSIGALKGRYRSFIERMMRRDVNEQWKEYIIIPTLTIIQIFVWPVINWQTIFYIKSISNKHKKYKNVFVVKRRCISTSVACVRYFYYTPDMYITSRINIFICVFFYCCDYEMML